MSTMVDTHEPTDSLACTGCGTTVPQPAPMQYRPLWEAGWRWIGSQELFSCPGCPPVIVVDEQGRHLRGPGATPAVTGRRPSGAASPAP